MVGDNIKGRILSEKRDMMHVDKKSSEKKT